MRTSLTMSPGALREQIAHTLTRFFQAEQSGNAGLVQKAYEDLFILCYRNDLELSSLLDEMDEGECGAKPSWPATVGLRASAASNHKH